MSHPLILGHLSPHNLRVVLIKQKQGEWLGEYVGNLLLAGSCLDGDDAAFDVLSEVMVFNVQMFCSWSHFGHMH